MKFIEYLNNNLEKEVLKLFINSYYNIHEISKMLNISECEIESILDKYNDVIKYNSFTEIIIK